MTARWDPLPLAETMTLFAAFDAPWWIAGGVAIELALGRRIRDHGDLDVLILRRDQHRLRTIMRGWDLSVAERGRLRLWEDNTFIDAPGNSAWCRRETGSAWKIEILLDESLGNDWISRRCSAIARPLASLGWFTTCGIPVLAAEVQLYYKARRTRPCDECDFDAILETLSLAQKGWLDGALGVTDAQHPWRSRLQP